MVRVISMLMLALMAPHTASACEDDEVVCGPGCCPYADRCDEANLVCLSCPGENWCGATACCEQGDECIDGTCYRPCGIGQQRCGTGCVDEWRNCCPSGPNGYYSCDSDHVCTSGGGCTIPGCQSDVARTVSPTLLAPIGAPLLVVPVVFRLTRRGRLAGRRS